MLSTVFSNLFQIMTLKLIRNLLSVVITWPSALHVTAALSLLSPPRFPIIIIIIEGVKDNVKATSCTRKA